MSSYVFILGAGASAHVGAPLMNNFLDTARGIYERAQSLSQESRSSFRRVFAAMSRLQVVHSKADLDLVNLESVFGAFEIKITLEQTMMVDTHSPVLPYGYGRLAGLLASRKESQMQDSVITFNYDTALDYCLVEKFPRVDYGLGEGENEGGFPLLKLHGSLNWASCKVCKRTVSRPVELKERGVGHNTTRRFFLADPDPGECCNQRRLYPAIVPPSWDKAEYRASVGSVWKRAASVLAAARNVVIIGYSLPESDSFFRYLFALGTVGPELLERLWLINPSEEVCDRFERLVGPGAQRRFRWYNQRFDKKCLDTLVAGIESHAFDLRFSRVVV
jgi:hypothetical protein